MNSALQRARAGMREHLPAERQDWTGGEQDDGTRELVRRYVDAGVATDIDGLAGLLRDDVRCSMPPTPGLYVGRDAVVNDWVESGFEGMKHLRAVLTSVNRQPAVAFYLWLKREGAYLPLTIDVLRVTGRAISEIVTVPRRPVPAARAAGASAGGRHGVVPVWTLGLRGGEPGRISDATRGYGSAAPASAHCGTPGRPPAGVHIVAPGAGPSHVQSTHPPTPVPK